MARKTAKSPKTISARRQTGSRKRPTICLFLTLARRRVTRVIRAQSMTGIVVTPACGWPGWGLAVGGYGNLFPYMNEACRISILRNHIIQNRLKNYFKKRTGKASTSRFTRFHEIIQFVVFHGITHGTKKAPLARLISTKQISSFLSCLNCKNTNIFG